MYQSITWVFAVTSAIALMGCAHQEEARSLAVPVVAASTTVPAGPKVSLAIGQFDNRSAYMRGVFSDNVDRLGGQAQTLLTTHLQQSGRFSLMDRANLRETRQESAYKGQDQALKGADFLVTGQVTEFGRRNVGDRQLFGILGRGTTQVAYAKVTLNIVNTRTAEVIHAVQGAGEYSLSEREFIGFGGTAGYDATLNGKVLDLAIREAVDHLVAGVDSGALRRAP